MSDFKDRNEIEAGAARGASKFPDIFPAFMPNGPPQRTLVQEFVAAFRFVITKLMRNRAFAGANLAIVALGATLLAFGVDRQIVVGVIMLGCLAVAMEFR